MSCAECYCLGENVLLLPLPLHNITGKERLKGISVRGMCARVSVCFLAIFIIYFFLGGEDEGVCWKYEVRHK